MTPATELAQLAQDMTVHRDIQRTIQAETPYPVHTLADLYQGRADGYRAAALTLRRIAPCSAVRDVLYETAEDMGRWAARHRTAGRATEADWCTGYQRAMEDAAEMVTEHADGAP